MRITLVGGRMVVLTLLGASNASAQHEHMMMHGHAMHHEGMAMTGMFGPYSMQREASGTSWQPDASPHLGLHVMRGKWMLMLHGYAGIVYGRQGGRRGEDKGYSNNMVMVMGTRPLGPGTVGFRVMLSAEPASIGKKGYPLLLQTGETADGRTPLVDRQHPHDLFMELAATYAWIWSPYSSAFAYVGLPGEPALGPPAFMHRFSGVEPPEAPITHHWLDSTHITFGVATLGLVHDKSKLEVSGFRGREPDENRWNIESPKLDSWSVRLSQNVGAAWSLQASFGRLHSPEQLEPDVDQDRTTASVLHDRSWSDGNWQTTLAWGQDRQRPGPALDGWLLESAVLLARRHTVFARGERVEKNELFRPGEPLAGQTFIVGKAALGYILDIYHRQHLRGGIGAEGTLTFVPAGLEPAYGKTPRSDNLFVRLRLE